MPVAMIEKPASVARWLISSAETKRSGVATPSSSTSRVESDEAEARMRKSGKVRPHVLDFVEREAEAKGMHIAARPPKQPA